MRKVVIASDSFKGSLSSHDVAEAACDAILDVYPACNVVKVNIADGGEGMLDSLKDNIDAETVHVSVHDPLGRIIEAEYLIHEKDCVKTAIIETAQASGLTLLKDKERNPMITSSFGTGEIITDAFRKGCRKFIIGLGGSATNDGGTGMLEAIGFKFKDYDGNAVMNCCGKDMERIASIDNSHVDVDLIGSDFVIACDVDASFTGTDGATHIFAAQKGADKSMIKKLEKGMRSFENVIEKSTGIKPSDVKGSGAAGGIGGALCTFLGAKLQRGAELILDIISFDSIISDADLVITGEGRIDRQTFMGKAPYVIATRAASQEIPVIAIGGTVLTETTGCRHSIFMEILPICEQPSSPEELAEAMLPATARKNIRKTIYRFLTQRHQKNA